MVATAAQLSGKWSSWLASSGVIAFFPPIVK
jgi:hypothetical protein